MSSPSTNTQPQPPSSPAISTNRALVLLWELMASVGNTPGSHELLARLASIESTLRAASVFAPHPTSAPPPATSIPPSTIEDVSGPLVSQDVPMDEVPAPSTEGSTAGDVSGTIDSRGAPMVESSAPSLDYPAIVALSTSPRSPTTPPSPSPPHPLFTSTLVPSSSTVCSRRLRNTTPDQDELVESPTVTTPPPVTSIPAIPTNSPLASRARLLDPRASCRFGTEMEWRAFEPNWCLRYVPCNSKAGGYTVYPPAACSSCVEGRFICSGVNGVKCACCKAKHRVCSLYQDTFEGRAQARAIISGRKFVEGQVTAERAVKSKPGSLCVTHPNKRVHFLSPSSSGSSVLNETPPPPSTPCLPSASWALSSTDDSALTIAFAIRDAVVAAIEAFDQALEEQGLSSKARRKHWACD